MKQRIIFMSLAFCFFCFTTHAQQKLMDIKVKKLNGDSLPISSFGGSKILFVVLPLQSEDSTFDQLSAFVSKYKDSLKIVGILSIEDGFSEADGTGISSLYSSLPITILEGMSIRKGSTSQSPLLKWLTDRNVNGHYDIENVSIGFKFFVDETARLFAVLPRQVSFASPIMERIVNQQRLRRNP